MAEKKNREELTQQELLAELKKLNKAQIRIKRRTTFLLSVIAMLVLITSTLAWFTLNSFASIENLQMSITTGVDLRLDIENHGSDISQYKKILTNEMINSYLSQNHQYTLTDQKLDPLTSSNGISFQTQKGETRTAGKNTFLEFKVWFIASREMYVHLSSETVAALDNGTTSVTTTETGAKADVIRSVRISYEDAGSTAIYEPNAGAAVAGQTTFDIPSPMSYSNSTRIFHLDELVPKQITIRLWAEGNDPECDDDVQDANLNVQMLFSGTDENNIPFS